MKKKEKSAVVKQLADRLSQATITLVSEYRGMTVAESTEVRRKLRAVRGELKVAKNTLIRRAVKDTRFAPLDEKLGGPVGLIIGSDDPVELAKTLVGFKDLGDKFKLRGGVLDGRVLSAEEVQTLAMLPPREVVVGQLLGVIQAPASRLVRLLNEPGSALARLIDAIGKRNAAATQA
jgi:large subunit ribosomal protein L10